MADHLHSVRTQRSGYQYLFTDKHHGSDKSAARWSPGLSEEQEFSVFDVADLNVVFDDRMWMYGLLREEGDLVDLGTWEQQIAEFPKADEGQAWHGYPIFPVGGAGPPNRRGEKCRPNRVVFEVLEKAGLLNKHERRRLWKGDHT
jgi:hypothetical protein